MPRQRARGKSPPLATSIVDFYVRKFPREDVKSGCWGASGVVGSLQVHCKGGRAPTCRVICCEGSRPLPPCPSLSHARRDMIFSCVTFRGVLCCARPQGCQTFHSAVLKQRLCFVTPAFGGRQRVRPCLLVSCFHKRAQYPAYSDPPLISRVGKRQVSAGQQGLQPPSCKP